MIGCFADDWIDDVGACGAEASRYVRQEMGAGCGIRPRLHDVNLLHDEKNFSDSSTQRMGVPDKPPLRRGVAHRKVGEAFPIRSYFFYWRTP